MRKCFLIGLLCMLSCKPLFAQVSLTGGTYAQDFNTLSNTAGSTTNTLTIPGWLMTESGGGARDNEQYAVDAGGSNTGDTYSYGSAAATDRALGGLRSGTLIPLFGAFFTNNTGSTVTSLTISFTGEQWRLGTAGRQDSIGFEYSTNATGLTTGTWTTVTALTFITPTTVTTGAKDGNAAANRTARTHTITGLNIPDGATFYIRWTDYDVTGADDGLSVDDFSITPGSGAVTPVLSINDVSQAEGNSGLTDFVFTVSLSSPAGPGGVTFDIATADNTATIIGNDYSGRSTTGATISAGNSSYTFTVQVVGETIPEANETFFVNVTNVTGATVADGQGTGTIINDDVALTPIHDIQGPGLTSPIVGASVTTSGIVIGRRSNGFFIQEADATVDADPLTSEGIFVFTSSAPPAAAAVGNLVQVTGTVTEFIPGSDPNSPPQTELTSPSVLLLTTGNPLPAPVTLTSANTNPAGGFSQLEPFENMRVLVNGFNVIAPTGGFLTESSATSSSSGLFYGVITLPRPFREPGINIQDPLPSGAPATVTRWDGNPEIMAVASNALGAPVLDVNAGATVNNLVGPLDFRNRIYTIDIDPTVPAVVNNNSLSYSAVPTPNSNELTVGSFNLQRFYDNVDDPGGDAVLTLTAYNNRLNKASLAIRNALKTPDVLGVIEVENLNVLQTLATKINSDAVAAGDPNPNYTPYLVEGNDVGLIDVGFLVKTGRVTVNSVTQFGASTTYINPNTGSPETLNDRPPLVLDGTFTGVGCLTNNNFKVIVNHLRSLNGVDDPIDGNRIRTKKQQQAEFLANLIQGFQTADPTVKIVSIGDYNAFEFNDGYVDVIGTIKGTPTPAANVTLASADLVNPNLVNLIDSYIPVLKYSYNFNGSAQTLDHILVNNNMSSLVSRFAIARLNADFSEVFRNDASRPERISDHDAAVAYFSFPATAPPVLTCPNDTTVAACQTQSAVNTAFANWLATVTASGGINGVLSNNNAGAPSACGGSTTVTFTYTNDCSPTTLTCTATFNVTAPANVVLTCPINTTVASCQTQAAVNAQFAAWLNNASGSGGCNGVLTNNNTGAPSACGGSTTVTFTYTNSCAPTTTTCTATFTVPAPPTISITCPSALTVSCAAAVPAPNTALVTVNAGCGVVVTHISDVISAQTCANRYTITRTYRATDLCGNFAQCTQIITVNDQTPPVVTCPAPVTVSCASAVPAPNTALVTATDNCAGVITITHISDVISAQTCANRYTITRTYRATDVCGNFAECTQIITVNDQTPPVITCPAALTVSCASAVPVPNTALVTATDNCAGVVTITHVSDVITNQTCPNRFTLTRTYRATDVCGNFSECTQVITVNDQTAPVITCPANITVTTPVGSCTAVVNFTVTATDNCGAVTIVSSPASGTAFPIGTTTVTSTATDACGNSSTCTFTVTVLDAQAPVITAQPQNRTVCVGQNATFSVTAVTAPSAGGPLSYQWQQWNGSAWVNIAGATASTFTVNSVTLSMNTNTFRVVVTGLCTVVNSNAASLHVNPLPTIALTASPLAALLPNQITSITATVNPTGGSFVWSLNGSVIPGATGSVLGPINVNGIGTYQAVYTDPNGCTSAAASINITAMASSQLWVYPNPNTGTFNVRFYNQTGEQVTLKVFNGLGQVVYTQSLPLGVAYSNITVNLGNVPAGVYIVKIMNGTGAELAAKRIVVNN